MGKRKNNLTQVINKRNDSLVYHGDEEYLTGNVNKIKNRDNFPPTPHKGTMIKYGYTVK